MKKSAPPTPPEPKCETCSRQASHDRRFGCSHVGCPNRKAVTAAPPMDIEDGIVPARINDHH